MCVGLSNLKTKSTLIISCLWPQSTPGDQESQLEGWPCHTGVPKPRSSLEPGGSPPQGSLAQTPVGQKRPGAQGRPFSFSWQCWVGVCSASPWRLSQDTELIKNTQNPEDLSDNECELVSLSPEMVPGRTPKSLAGWEPVADMPRACQAGAPAPGPPALCCHWVAPVSPRPGTRASSWETHYSLSLSAFL